MAVYGIGDTISFSYKGEYSIHPSHTAIVLHPSWGGKMHGLSIGLLSPSEVGLFRFIMDPNLDLDLHREIDPKYAAKIKEFQEEFPFDTITDPQSFYYQIVKPFVMVRPRYTPYRTYFAQNMSNVNVVVRYDILTKQRPETGFEKYRRQFQFFKGPQGSRFKL